MFPIRRFLLSVVALSAAILPAQADYLFESLDSELPMELLRDIHRDSQGYIWAGCSGMGLIRHNSYSAVQYQHLEHDSNSICNSVINCIYEDYLQNLWIGTNDGLARYIREYDRFENYFPGSDSNALRGELVSQLLEDQDSVLWIVTSGGICRYNRQQDNFSSFADIPMNDPLFQYTSMAQDLQGRYWVVSTRNGIYEFVPSRRAFIHYPDPNISKESNDIKGVYIDTYQQIWIGSRTNGLSLFSPFGGLFTHYNVRGDGNGTNGALVFDLLQVGDQLLIAVDQGGINRYSFATGIFEYITKEREGFGNIASDGIYSLFQDQEDIIWVGTSRGGMMYANPKKQRFTTYRKEDKGAKGHLPNDIIGCVYEDSEGSIWVGTDGGGLSVLNPREISFVNYHNVTGDPTSLSSDIIRSVDEDREGNMWIATYTGGVNVMNRKTRKNRRVVLGSGENSTNQLISNLFIDSKGRRWVTMPYGATVLYDADLSVARTFFTEVSGYSFRRPLVYESPSGAIYLVNNSGAFLFSEYDYSVQKILDGEGLITFCITSDGQVYTGTYEHGVFRYDSNFRLVKSYNQANGLCYNTVNLILEGNDGNIWVSTMNGLSCINPQTDEITNYYALDGLQGNKFFFQSGCAARNGTLYFGGTNGLTSFNPKDIVQNATLAVPIIEAIYVSNRKLEIGAPDSILQKAAAYTDRIDLNWSQNDISIHFLAINFTYPQKNTYRYKLEGYDTEWITATSSTRVATYTNLDPGHYIFHLQAYNNDHILNPQEKTLQVVIHPPFWQQLWFYILIGILFIAGIYAYTVRREQKLRKDKQLLKEKVEERTRLISQQSMKMAEQNTELEKQRQDLLVKTRELEENKDLLEAKVLERTEALKSALERAEQSDELKSVFLTNMSHEIRTPMNAIVGFSNLLKREECTPQERDRYTTLIDQNSFLLMRLIDDILDFSLIESEQLQVYMEPFELNEFITKIYATYKTEVKGSLVAVRLRNELEELHCNIYSDEERIRQILNNLLNNAVKYTRKGSIEIRVFIDDNKLGFAVTDTGIGIAEEDLDAIFSQFVKLKYSREQAVGGIGLGLTISKRLSELLGGELEVASQKGKGTTFTFTLPEQVILDSTVSDHLPGEDLVAQAAWDSIKILVAEDQDYNYELIQALLKDTSVQLIWARDGQEAINKYTPDISLVLMDINMPVYDGYHALHKIREMNPDQKIVALTAYIYQHDRKKIQQAGFNDYLPKPIKAKPFFDLLHKYLSRQN